jgi:hypothetical protein
MDETMRDPAIIEPVGLNPETVKQLWQAFLAQASDYTGLGYGRFIFS